MKIGDSVIFDHSKIEIFKSETTSSDKAISQYQELVLAGIDQTGIIIKIEDNLSYIGYPDGWELPIPTKYLIPL